MKTTGIADTAYFGPELEFFVFDDVRYDQNAARGLLLPRQHRRATGTAAATRSRTSATSCATRKATSPCRRPTSCMDIRNEMMLTMIDCGMDVEAQHHEVATGGQCEIDMRFHDAGRDGRQGAEVQVHRQERGPKHGKTATFMPKPLFMDNGTGMHVHISLWKDGKHAVRRQRATPACRDMAHVRHRRPAQARPGVLCASPTRRPTATSGWCRATRRR